MKARNQMTQADVAKAIAAGDYRNDPWRDYPSGPKPKPEKDRRTGKSMFICRLHCYPQPCPICSAYDATARPIGPKVSLAIPNKSVDIVGSNAKIPVVKEKMKVSETVKRMTAAGFRQTHGRIKEMISMSKQVRPWKQVIALVGMDGNVNGGSLDEFLAQLNNPQYV